jgi:hypothetical protein
MKPGTFFCLPALLGIMIMPMKPVSFLLTGETDCEFDGFFNGPGNRAGLVRLFTISISNTGRIAATAYRERTCLDLKRVFCGAAHQLEGGWKEGEKGLALPT